jgi:hypothetical protein
MTTNNEKMTRNENPHLVSILAKGMLFWGPAYAVAASTTAYELTVHFTDKTPSYSEILIDALMLFQLWGLIGGAVKWMVISHDANHKKRRKRRRLIFPSGRLFRLRPKHA